MSHKGKEVMVAEEESPISTSNPVLEAAEGSSKAKTTLILRSSDGEEFEIEEFLAAMGSEHIKKMIEDGCTDAAVLLHNVTAPVLAKMIQYWCRHAQGDEGSEELKEWDATFANMEDHDKRFDLILAANYLDAKPLLDLLCQAVADTIKDFTVEQVREYLDIENDFTPEEMANIRLEIKWAFEQ